MKRVMICALAFACFANVSKAQKSAEKGFYLKAAGGYFFSVSPGQFPKVGAYDPVELYQTYTPTSATTGTYSDVSRKVLTGSYGQGMRGGISGGYNFNRYIAVELTANYYHSAKNLMTHQVTNQAGTGTLLGSVESHGFVNAIDLAPSIVISPGLQGKFNPYVRFGAAVPIWGRLHIETDGYKVSSLSATQVLQTTVHRKEEIKPNATIGFQGALGVNYKATKTLSIFLEAEYRNVPVGSKSKEVTSYNETSNIINTSTGASTPYPSRGLNDLSTAERYTDYKTTLDQSSNTPTGAVDPAHLTQTQYKNNNSPSNDLRSFINIGGLGLNLGVKIKI
ncbi:MAG: outer membrane beta-barrel protein [Filimonas sp.]|nr:outer membrane beta-barrel protein [Filimonas sp.]